MKYLAALAISAFLIPSVSFAAAFDRNLYYGTSGQDVSALQEFLTDQGVYTGPISGNFYSLTLSAVKRFQSANNISPVSGYFGVLSRGVANTLLEPVAPIEETGTTTAPVIVPEPVVQAPTFGTISPINTPVPQQTASPAPVVASCDSAIAASINFSTSTVDIVNNPQGYFYVTANVADGCGKTYPFTITQGSTIIKRDVTGATTIALTGSNVWQWEVLTHESVAQGAPATYPFPVSVFSPVIGTSTQYISVQ